MQNRAELSLNCFNFALMDASASTVAQLVSLLVQDYDFELIIWGLQAHSFYSLAESNENYFSESTWIQYRLGDFNFEGWLNEHSYLFRALKIYLPLLYFPDSLIQVDASAQTERDRHVIKSPEESGYNAILTYRSSAPLFAPDEDAFVHYLTSLSAPSHADWQAIDVMGQLSKDNNFRLVLVEFPTMATDGSSRAVMAEAAAYAQARGIPFLSTQTIGLPITAYTDTVESTTQHYIHNHFHVSGSILFSGWLGTQIGDAFANDAFDDVHHPLWTPSAQTLTPDYEATLGFSREHYQQYQTRQKAFTLLPAETVIFNPSPVELDRVFLQSNLGLLMERQPEMPPDVWQENLDLMVIFDRMRYRSELDQPALTGWYESADPVILRAAGITYLMCRQESEVVTQLHCPPAVYENPAYTAIRSWGYAPFSDQYHLFYVGMVP